MLGTGSSPLPKPTDLELADPHMYTTRGPQHRDLVVGWHRLPLEPVGKQSSFQLQHQKSQNLLGGYRGRGRDVSKVSVLILLMHVNWCSLACYSSGDPPAHFFSIFLRTLRNFSQTEFEIQKMEFKGSTASPVPSSISTSWLRVEWGKTENPAVFSWGRRGSLCPALPRTERGSGR